MAGVLIGDALVERFCTPGSVAFWLLIFVSGSAGVLGLLVWPRVKARLQKVRDGEYGRDGSVKTARQNTRRRALHIAGVWCSVVFLFLGWHCSREAASPARFLAAQVPQRGCVISATGVIDEVPAPSATARVKLRSFQIPGQPLHPSSATVLVRFPEKAPAYGTLVEFTGSAERIAGPRNPGEFSTDHHLQKFAAAIV